MKLDYGYLQFALVALIGKHVEIYLRHPRLEDVLEKHVIVGQLAGVSTEGYLVDESSEYSRRRIFIPREHVLYVATPLPLEGEDDDGP